MDQWIGASASVMWALLQSVMVKKQLRQKAKLLIYSSVFVPVLSCGREVCITTKRTWCKQPKWPSFAGWPGLASEMGWGAPSSGLRVDPLLLLIERSRLRWFWHLIRKSHRRLSLKDFRARPTSRRTRENPETVEPESSTKLKPYFYTERPRCE